MRQRLCGFKDETRKIQTFLEDVMLQRGIGVQTSG
jgi:hypothetical protein